MTTQIVNSPIFIEDFPAESNQIARGFTAKRRIIIKNLGDRRADIDIWIAALDTKSEPLLRWCNFSEPNPIRINPKENCEIILYFEVPPQATPELYNYEILIEAPVQYPNKIFRRPQQLRVLRSDRDTEWTNEPGFTLQPLTTSANPYLLQAGEKLLVKVAVENRSKRVDRFYLTCPELPKEWFSVRYPESQLDISGLVRETDGLELNPGNTGEITLILHLPKYTPTGYYFPTVRLISNNKEDLVFLDVIYLQIIPCEILNILLSPPLQRIPTDPGLFEIELVNEGNINRQIEIIAKDKENLFTYILEFPPETILPGHTNKVPLKVKPRKWWRRPLWGKRLEFDFAIELVNIQTLEDFETAKPPTLPKELPLGTLLWEPRPWWQILLPVVLLLLLLLGLISVGAFLGWQKFIIQPKINKVEPTPKVYKEKDGKPIKFNLSLRNLSNWEFKNWRFIKTNKLSTVKIIAQNSTGLVKIISYNYDQLSQSEDCQLLSGTLDCKNISTEITQAGNYTFKVEAYALGKNKPSDLKQTDTVVIEPIPIPKVIIFGTTKVVYQEELKEQIILKWEISNANQIQKLLVTQQGGIGSPIQKSFIQCKPQISSDSGYQKTSNIGVNITDILACQKIATNITKAGTYSFKLEIFSKQNAKEPSDTKQTDTITIEPLPLPKITEQVLTNKVSYEYKEPISLSWKIINPRHIQEMRIVQQSSDGSVVKTSLSPAACKIQQPTPVSTTSNSFPKPSSIENPNTLICDNIRVIPAKAGNYSYKIEITSKGEPNQTSESKETDTITVQPLPIPKVTALSSTKPFYEAAKNEEIFLKWEITNAEQIKELKLVGLAPDGSISNNLKRYIIINNNLPPELRSFCTLAANLNCQQVPTGAKQAGIYTFKLTVVPKQNPDGVEITEKTPTINVKPIPPKPPTPVNIIAFKVNGQDVSEKQKYVYEINKERKPVDIVLSWQVHDGEDIKVELLPFGDVQKAQGSKTYTLSKPPSSVTITLKVTNKAGEQKTQSVVLETVETSSSSQPQTLLPGETAPGENAPNTTSPTPSTSPSPFGSSSFSSPDEFSPIELPPSPD